MRTRSALIVLAALSAAACGGAAPEHGDAATAPARAAGSALAVAAETVADHAEATGVAEPVMQATLSTRLMGTVTAVRVREGDVVPAGAPLVEIDARDLAAKEQQVAASVAEAEAMLREAETHAERIRALYAEEAAPRAQLDAAETGLARARAGVAAARAGGAELAAVRDYSVVRAPFAGTVTARMVDPGAFAAPGAPLVTMQDPTRLRVSATAPPEAVRGLRRGDAVAVRIEGVETTATVEGVVPAPAGQVYTINALVENPDGRFLPGSAATILIPRGERTAVFVPQAAVVRQGDLTGVDVRTAEGATRRWVRLGREVGGRVEVLSGLRAGETIVVPARTGGE